VIEFFNFNALKILFLSMITSTFSVHVQRSFGKSWHLQRCSLAARLIKIDASSFEGSGAGCERTFLIPG
jgi:hypothetical protein